MNVSGGRPNPRNLSVQVEHEQKTLADHTGLGRDRLAMSSSDEFVSQMATENQELRVKVNTMSQQVEQLMHKLTQMKTQPVRLESSPDQAAKILRLESDKQRLMVQLSEKSQLVEELKLRVQDQPEGSQVRSRVEAMRREVEAELKVHFDIKHDELRNALDLLRKDLEEAHLKLSHKEKECEIMGETISSLEMSALEEHEKLRTTLLQTLWDEFEKKLIARKNEFDERCQNYLGEQERLTQVVKEWRRKCVELEDKNAQLYGQLNNTGDDDMELRKTITNYENEVYSLRMSLERANQVNNDLQDQNAILNDKISYLDSDISRYHEKEGSLEDRLMEQESKVRALTKELERSKLDCETWKEQLSKYEKDNSKLRLSIHELQNQLKTNDRFKSSNSKELLWERTNTERLGIEVMSLETELRTALATRDAFKEQLEKTKEEVLIKNALIEDFKKYNLKLQSAQNQIGGELAKLKGDLTRESETADILRHQIGKLAQERDDLAYKLESDKLRNSRPERSALSMLNKPRDASDIENKLLMEKLQEKDVEIQGLKTKLGSFYRDLQPLAKKLEDENDSLRVENSRLKEQLDFMNQERVRNLANIQQNPFSVAGMSGGPQDGFAASSVQNQSNLQGHNLQASFGQFRQSTTPNDQDRSTFQLSESLDRQHQEKLIAELMQLRKFKDEHEKSVRAQQNQPVLTGHIEQPSANNDVDSLSKQLQGAKQEIEDLMARLSLQKSMVDNSKKKADQTMDDFNKLNADYGMLQARCNTLIEENKALAQMKSAAEARSSQIQADQDRGSKFELENRRLAGLVEDLKVKDAANNRARQDLEGQISTLQDQLATLRRQMTDMRHAQTLPATVEAQNVAESRPLQPQTDIDHQGQLQIGQLAVNEIDFKKLIEDNSEMGKELATRDKIIKELQDNLGKNHTQIGEQNAFLTSEIEYLKAYMERVFDEKHTIEHHFNELIAENENLRNDNTYLANLIQEKEVKSKPQLQLKQGQREGEGQVAREADMNNQILDLRRENTDLLREIQALERNVGLK